MSRPPRRLRGAPALAGAAVLLLTACGGDPAEPSDGPAAGESAEHGFVAGAEELAEPQLQLAYLDDAGSVHALDLLTEEAAALGEVGAVSAVGTDGRFLFAASEPAGELTVVDTGTWTVDHGDHVHYYRAPAGVAGTLEWSGGVRVASSETLTALFSPDTGTGVVLDRAALGQGEVTELARVESEPHDGALVPLGSRLVATTADAVVALDLDGEPLPGAEAECAEPRGGHPTRVGVVVSCADGAVLATETDDGIDLERIAYPVPVADEERAGGLANRPGRPAVAAPAGDRGVWLLDTRARSWQLVPTETPWVRAVAAGDEEDRVVGVDAAGRVVVLTPDGRTAATEPLLPVDRLDQVDLQVAADRAYVNDPAGRRLLEIDYADGARLARTFPAAVAPAHLAETGR
ncbi:ABC transporter [Blastococcus sp. TF02A-26]|uniref:ABC transporter n=1 Tax=Blastococcus sp. TF02A-26 TaxID=2250577 RepID=UPI000DEB9329|nr:ABC transporter [Blastococcus sp. TF02A-26]RBY86910.1 ABC transporter [Blastococcus sp. TF02A-26]